jgi:hypothetical protein
MSSSATCSQISPIQLIILMWQIETLKQINLFPQEPAHYEFKCRVLGVHAWSGGTIWKTRRWQSRRLLQAGGAGWHHSYGTLHCWQTHQVPRLGCQIGTRNPPHSSREKYHSSHQKGRSSDKIRKPFIHGIWFIVRVFIWIIAWIILPRFIPVTTISVNLKSVSLSRASHINTNTMPKSMWTLFTKTLQNMWTYVCYCKSCKDTSIWK